MPAKHPRKPATHKPARRRAATKKPARRNPGTGGCAAALARSPIAALLLAEDALATVQGRAHPGDREDLADVLRGVRARRRDLEAIRDRARSSIG
jgi:hypothetical protein